MSQNDSNQSPFDKNLRSLLDALAMFEREAGVVMDRFGFEADSVGRVMELLGNLSSEAVRPLAAAIGIADAASVEALARDVRALLQSEARIRRQHSEDAGRVDELLAAVEALGATTARLADLQTRTQDRLDNLADRAEAIEATDAQRKRLAEEVARLATRIDDLETSLSNDPELGPRSVAADGEAVEGIRPPGGQRPAPRALQAAPANQKILEGLPRVEPKVRPA